MERSVKCVETDLSEIKGITDDVAKAILSNANWYFIVSSGQNLKESDNKEIDQSR